MMQVLPIILVAVVMAVDGGLTPLGREWNLPDWLPWMDLWLPPLAMLLVAWLIIHVCVGRLRRGRVPGPFITADRTMRATRWFIVINQVFAILVLDGLGAIRRVTGDLILIDELLAIMPGILALIATWWVHYPVERLLIESSLMRRLDVGSPVYPPLSRAQYMVVQARINLLLLLLPVLLIAGTSEVIDQAWGRWSIGSVGAREAVTIFVAAGIFLVSPLLARAVLDTEPLPPGPLRDALSGVCRRHRVGVRDLLLWKTNGSMINAAVMGLIGPLRYVLITDALLETLHEREVHAVMAHEVGHVRRKHMVWMVLCLLACFLLAAHLVEWPLRLSEVFLNLPEAWMQQAAIVSAALQLLLGLAIFGWVCRRFERQADTFAVQHLSGLGTPRERDAGVTMESVDAMRSALQTIAELNSVDPARHSWRHGSIRWRQMYLETLIDRPLKSLPIDRLVRRLKAAAFLVLVLGITYEVVARQQVDQVDRIEFESHP